MKTIIIDGIEYELTPAKSIEQEIPYNDWRLPTIQELLTLVNYEKCNPACDLEDTKSYYYWSSSTNAYTNDFAWDIYFYHGYNNANCKNNSKLVRCVRDGIDGLEWSATSSSKMNWHQAIEYAKNLVAPVYYKESI